MSKFLKNSDLELIDVENIVSNTLNNCDDGELYLENSKSETILLDDNKIGSSVFFYDKAMSQMGALQNCLGEKRFAQRGLKTQS